MDLSGSSGNGKVKLRGIVKEESKRKGDFLDVKSGAHREWSQGKFRCLGEFSELKEVMAHFPGSKVF